MLKKIPVALLAFALAGCASPQEKAKDANDAQEAADDQASRADDETQAKAEVIQDNADKQKAAAEKAEDKKVDAAQKNADAKSADAAQALVGARLEAQTSNEQQLAALEAQFAELKPKLVKKLSKANYDATVKDLTAKSEAVRKSIGDLASATADSLEPVKATIKQRQLDFATALTEAKKRT